MSEIQNFLDQEGRLKQFPARRKMKLEALAYIAQKLDSNREYTEKQFNEALCEWHTFNDPATLRRELYNNRFVNRSNDGKVYTIVQKATDETD